MTYRLTHTKMNGKKNALVRDSSGKPREFTTKGAARRFVRTHQYEYTNLQIVSTKP